jgi:hydrogenase/urease accessory protein HupE
MKLIYILFLLVYSQIGFAHAPGLSSADVVLTSTGVDANITFALQDIEAFSPMDSDGDADISPAEYDNAKPHIAALIAKELEFTVNDQIVEPISNGEVTFDDKNNAHVKLRYEPAATHLKMVMLLLKKLPEGHKQYVTIKDAEGKSLSEKMLTQEDNAIELDINAQDGSMFKDFLVLGIEHILTGYDHLLFLFALLMVTRNFWSAVGIITFFTIAHSITLGLAGLGLVTLPSSVVEPLIAATIIYVGLENLISKEPKGRRLLTFSFGLIHGFGFASVLEEMGISSIETGILVPLFSFNFGVEIGQIVVTSLVLPFIWWLHKKPSIEKYFLPVCSTIVSIAGAIWLLQRTVLQ